MEREVPYRLSPASSSAEPRAYQWVVADGVQLVRPKEDWEAIEAAAQVQELAITDAFWSDDAKSAFDLGEHGPAVLLFVGQHEDFQTIKDFTSNTDRRFFLEAEGHPTLNVGTGVGGCSRGDDCYVVLGIGPRDWADLVPNVAYSIRAQNGKPDYRWTIPKPLTVSRSDLPDTGGR